MSYPWLRKMPTEDEGYCVSFDGIESKNDGDTCISCIVHSVLNDLSGAVCIDVGADLGWWGLFCKWVNPTSVIYAFEPNPKTYPLLERYSSDTFHIFNTAVSDKHGELLMEFEDSNSNSRANTGTPVKMMPLDFIFDKVQNVHLIKVDTEGRDLTIVNSLEKFFPRIYTIIFEFTVYWNGKSVQECIQNSLESLMLLERFYPYIYIVSRRGFPKLIHITDTSNFIPIIMALHNNKIQVDILCSKDRICGIHIVEEEQLLENIYSIIY